MGNQRSALVGEVGGCGELLPWMILPQPQHQTLLPFKERNLTLLFELVHYCKLKKPNNFRYTFHAKSIFQILEELQFHI